MELEVIDKFNNIINHKKGSWGHRLLLFFGCLLLLPFLIIFICIVMAFVLAVVAIYLSIILGVVGGFFFLIIYLLTPLNFDSVSMSSIANLNSLNFDFSQKTLIQIIDSNFCSDYQYGACVEKKCQYSLVALNDLFDCKYTFYLSNPISFDNFVFNCSSDAKCSLNLNSQNFHATNLFIFGYDFDVRASLIKANNLFYDTKQGDLKVELLQFDIAKLNTSQGDIVVQTTDSTYLTTYTKSKYVCTTSAQTWKDNTNKIASLDEAFQEKDADKNECFSIFAYNDRNQSAMIDQVKHSVIDQIPSLDYSNSEEKRCIFLNNIILMNNNNNPSVGQPKQIFTSNSEGNIFINVLSSINNLDKQLPNLAYENPNVQLSSNSYSNLNSTIRSIVDKSKTNEIIHLDFRTANDFTHNFVFTVIFNPIYLHLTPEWLAALSFNSLSSDQEQIKLLLQPGMCPFIFSYSTVGNEEKQDSIVASRESLISQIIDSFFEDEDISPYLIIPYSDYQAIRIRKEGTYPDIQNINQNIKIIISTEIICVLFILIFLQMFQAWTISLRRQFIKNNYLRDKQKIIFFFLQQNIQNKSVLDDPTKQNESPKTLEQSPILGSFENQHFKVGQFKQVGYPEKDNLKNDIEKATDHVGGIQKEVQSAKDDSEKQIDQENKTLLSGSNNINKEENNNTDKLFISNENNDQLTGSKEGKLKRVKLGANIQVKDDYTPYLFQTLSTQCFQWIQERYTSSLQIFLGLLEKIKSASGLKVKDDEKLLTQIDLKDLIQYYQKFCYLFNMQEESIQNEELPFFQYSNYRYSYDMTIVFEKFKNDSSQEEGDFIVSLNKSKKKQISQFIKYHGQFKEPIKLSLFSYLFYLSKIKTLSNRKYLSQYEQDSYLPILSKQQEIEFENKLKESETKLNDQKKNSENQNNLEKQDVKQVQSPENEEVVHEQSYYDIDYDDEDEEINKEDIDNFYIYGTYNKILAADYLIQEMRDDNYIFIETINSQFFYAIDQLFKECFMNPKVLEEQKNNTSNLYQIPTKLESKCYSNISEEKQQEIDEAEQFNHRIKMQRMKRIINSDYLSSFFSIKKKQELFAGLIRNVRFLSIQLLYIGSPLISCFLSIIFIAIFLKSANKFDINDYIKMGNQKDKFQQTFDFTYTGISLLAISCCIFSVMFYLNLYQRNTIQFSLLADNNYLVSLKKIEKPDDITEHKKDRLGINLYGKFKNIVKSIYLIITNIILLLQIVYITVGFIVLIIGAVLFPSVQLPTLIFFGVLLGVVISSITTFKEAYTQGLVTLEEQFQTNVENKWKQYLKVNNKTEEGSDKNDEETKKEEDEDEEKDNENQNNNQKLRKNINIRFLKLAQKQMKNEKIFGIKKEELKKGSQSSEKSENVKKTVILKDLKIYQNNKYFDIFNQINGSSDMELSEQEFKDFLKAIEMPLNQTQLDCLYAYLYVNEKQNHLKDYIKVWKIKKTMDYNKFEMAIDYLIKKKVKQSLFLLDISYASLCLSIFKTIFQSIIIAWVIYSVFVGLSSSEGSFDFSANSIISFGGVIGILFSKEDKAKVFEDEEVIAETIMKVETHTHSYN